MTDITLRSAAPNGIAQIRASMLHVLHGAMPVAHVLEHEPIMIGRLGHVTGPLALTDSEVSRHHATITPTLDGWLVVDNGSRNGTFVDGRRVDCAALTAGGVIRVGRTVIVYTEAQIRSDERLAAPTDTMLVGGSVAAMRIHGEIALVAKHDMPVLVLGETGVGKELIAEEIHRRSKRPGAFIALNCAAIAAELAESELFGHVAGAFTGASRASDGLFVAADQGTLFLDEVGELPPELQAKLLRALATGQVPPRAAGAGVPASRRHAPAEGQRPGDRRDAPRPR